MNNTTRHIHTKLLGIILILALLSPLYSMSKDAAMPESTESTDTSTKLSELNDRKAELTKKIKAEDKKRNRTIDGVSIETMERLNIQQDSLCLALRSELVDVELEIEENTPTATSASIASQYSNIGNTTPNKPVSATTTNAVSDSTSTTTISGAAAAAANSTITNAISNINNSKD